jgi:hypothetical protein
MSDNNKVSKLAVSSKLSDKGTLAELLGVPVNQELDSKMLIKALNYRRSTITVEDDFFSGNKADEFIHNNEFLITELGKDILTHSEIDKNLQKIWTEKNHREFVISFLSDLICQLVIIQLKRDFSFLQKLKGEITSRKSIIKIDAGYIFYKLEENQTFVDYEKLKYYLIDLSLIVRSIFHLFGERNSTWLEEYFKLYQSNKFNLSDNNLRSNVIRAINELKSKEIKVTQKAIAEIVGFKRTTLIERCKNEAFDLSSLIKAYK